ncbi:MAG: tetratricopeptide repeat protein [Acidobacteria bacterium]|nr:tetratricopeptide repeat protein [Acidobacteriota bacterium]
MCRPGNSAMRVSRWLRCSEALAWAALALPGAQSPHELHLNKGAAEMQTRRFQSAIAEFTRAIALNPRSGRAHLLLGEAYLATGAQELIAEAKGEFQQARELDPQLHTARFYIVKIDLDLGRLSRTEREIAESPPSPYLDALLGEVRRQQGRPREALKLASQALAALPDAPLFLYYRAMAHWDHVEDEAAALADLARMAQPTPEALILAARIHLVRQRPAEAEEALRRALTLGERAEAHLRLAQSYRARNRPAEARTALAAFRAAPQLSSAHFEKLSEEADREEKLLTRRR